jgi:paraquat-inducible protein B
MSEKSNPTAIGAFVVGAIILLATGAALFGGAEFFAKKHMYVTYFTENAKGLRVGSNVMMNGVHVGQVSKVALIIDQNNWESKTEVVLEVRPESYMVTKDGVAGHGEDIAVILEDVVRLGGLRASLQVESFVTGQLAVEVAFRPGAPAVLRGGANAPYPEIPTIPSDIKKILASIQTWLGDMSSGLESKELAQRIQNILRGADELANSKDIRESLAGVNSIINRTETQQLTPALQATLDEVRRAATDAGSLLRNADGLIDSDLKPAIAKLEEALNEAEQALVATKYHLRGESVQVYQLGETLREVEGAARAIREFMDYMESHPEAVLKGKNQ